jgi:hypothetical protein
VATNGPIVHHPGDMSMEKRTPELSDKTTSSHLVAKQEELANEMMNFALRNIFFILRRVI